LSAEKSVVRFACFKNVFCLFVFSLQKTLTILALHYPGVLPEKPRPVLAIFVWLFGLGRACFILGEIKFCIFEFLRKVLIKRE
jgi:hypothetical protein